MENRIFFPSNRTLEIASHALGNVQQGLGLARRHVESLDRTAALKTGRIDLAGLEHGGRVVVIAPVLLTNHKQDRLTANQVG
jgi:hypothetical protein